MTATRRNSSNEPASGILALSNDLADAVEQAGWSIVAIHARPRIPASGVYWRDDLIVAASHTIRREQEIPVSLPDGTRAQAQLVGRDGGTDLALLRLSTAPSADSVRQPKIAPADALRVGALVTALGRAGSDGVSASLGIVSAVGGRWRTWSGGEIDRFVRLDLAIYDGFSGGALVDVAGRIAGVNCSALARRMPITIPVPTVQRVVDALRTRGRVPRGYLGVAMQPVRVGHGLTERLGLEVEAGEAGARAVLLMSIEPGSPAEQAGLLVGDLLVAVDGKRVTEPSEIAEFLGPDRVGARLALSIVRGGTRQEVDLTIGERPGVPGRERR